MDIKQWLGENNDLGIDIWNKKYCYNGETFEQWLERISNGNEKIAQLIREKKFLFAGRILANRGLDKFGKKITYSNCYVMPPVEDSIESIYKTCADLARTYSYSGGCGVDISKLRPRGMKVNNASNTTTGAVSFMDTFSQVTGTIGQNGRRGALLISIDCKHPDLEEFIGVKNDLDRVTKANISVRVTDDFMRAVENDSDWELYFKTEHGDEMTKIVKAKKVYRMLCENNYNYAEPGLLFWDNINDYNLVSEDPDFEYAGVNPCLTGDTLIQTTEGEIPIKDLVGTQPYVYCMDGLGRLIIKQASKVWMTRKNAELVKINHHRGSLICTPDHLIFTLNRGWVKAKDLQPKDKLNGLGRSMKDEKHCCVKLTSEPLYHSEHRFIASYFEDIFNKDVHHINDNPLDNRWSNLEVLNHGVHSKITNLGHEDWNKRNEKGQFIPVEIKKKRDTLEVNRNVTGKTFRVISVETLDYTEDVYDMTVPEVHNFVANSIIVHNCAEETLPAGGSCLLGSINLAEYVKDKEFDYNSFKIDIHTIVRAMNEVLDQGLPLHPLQIQRDTVRDLRQIGIGIMGLADMLIKLEIQYDSDEALNFCDKLGFVMANESLYASALLAKEFGPYPKYNKDAILRSEFLYVNTNNETFELVEKWGLRNSQILTIPPCGTLSTMLGISGGIEPIFSLSYTRKTEYNGEDRYHKVFTKIADEYMKEHGLKEEEELPKFFVTAQNINPFKRVEMQGVWQRHIDASISSTVNLPNSATIEEVESLYLHAWKNGLKGMTIFRDGCKRAAVLTTGNKKEEKKEEVVEEKVNEIPRGVIVPTNDNVIGLKRKISGGCGSLHIQVYFDSETGKMSEVFINKGGSGGCNSNLNALSRMISLALRGGIDVKDIADQLDSTINCPSFASSRAKGIKLSPGSSCANAVGKVLVDLNNEFQKLFRNMIIAEDLNDNENTDDIGLEICPECGKKSLEMSGGCQVCKECGNSKCD